ncbi:MAG: preprotein translocase subunit SecG [Ardenticatenia bacterium]|nr:preprotein translocase subunit SecG [Ardenticatenia bacterium]
MLAALYTALILLSIGLVAVVLLQAKGSGLGSAFGGEGGVTRTRRGVEKTIFQLTIVLAVLFFLLDLIVVLVSG